MNDKLDYEAIGLRSGLEVHQQLLTREKLFCRCPAGLYTETHDGEVLRHMRPTLSELGEYDGTALMEFKTKKEIVYLLNRLNVCTYEMDDTPPFLVNQQAIDIAIEICLMMGMDIIDEVHIARKQYLDGSIPTGFQRTAIIGVGGSLPFNGRDLSVTHLSVEEDSCREVEDKGHQILFRTDRLGVPLTETVTGPELVTPAEVREAILLCGLVARSTGHVRTGMGAARQDVNVSVRGGNRVEIKGVAKAGHAVLLVHNEAVRQVNLLRLRDELHARGLRHADDIKMTSLDVTSLFDGVELKYIRDAMEQGGRVLAVKIEGIGELTRHPTQPRTTFLDELSGRVRVIACLDDPPILLAGAQMPEYPQLRRVRHRIGKKLRVGDQDDFFLVWGAPADCQTAAQEIRIRWAEATQGVPKETRQPLIGGFTTFERILPGPDRMYPDTDSPPTQIDRERVERLRRHLPPAPWERLVRYGTWGVPDETSRYLIRRGLAALVDRVVEQTGVDGRLVAMTLGQKAKAMGRKGVPTERLKEKHWVAVFQCYAEGRIPEEGVSLLARAMACEPTLSREQAMEATGLGLLPADQWQKTLNGFRIRPFKRDMVGHRDKHLRQAIGEAMRALAGKAPAKEVSHYIREHLDEVVV